ncbi:MAG: chorismate synthase [Sandaracinaceae bacterium]
MAGSTLGVLFRVTTAGESHGPGQVVIVDGCPPGLALDAEADLQPDLDRRRPGQSAIVSPRQEPDRAQVLSGVLDGRTTGAPIAVLIRNADARSQDYDALRDVYRPGHADYTVEAKYGVRDHRGGGRASARETVARVVAGAIAKRVLADAFGGRVLGFVRQIGGIVADVDDPAALTQDDVERWPDGSPNPVRCPDAAAAGRMIALIEELRREEDSIGGVAEIVATGVPAGLGEPVFDKLKADLGKALFSLPAVVGVEYGVGFGAATRRGSEVNDAFLPAADAEGPDAEGAAAEGAVPAGAVPAGAVPTRAAPTLRTETNRHGGMLGGISSGMPIVLRCAVKPTSSLSRPQRTADRRGEAATVRTRGRHDPCLLPRFIPMGEAMVALVLADHWLRQRAVGRASP